MLVVFLIAAAVVLGGVFFAATGRGGELAPGFPDYAPLDLGPVSAPDIAMLRPPTALWGYNVQATDEALDQIARAMRDRDITIAYLQRQLTSRTADYPSASPAAIAAQNPPPLLGSPTAGAQQPPRASQPPWVLVAPRPHEPPPPHETSQPPAPSWPHETPPPHEVTQPADPALSVEATHPAAALPVSAPDVPGPQGAYDAHDWWAQQEEAAREEALRQAQAKAHAEASPNPAVSSTQPNPAVSAQPNPAVTSTQPNPAVASQSDDDARAVTEEQSW
ncbi:MAG: hypothetical protein ABSB76_09405 [Streptosporangiaceae bacterium]